MSLNAGLVLNFFPAFGGWLCYWTEPRGVVGLCPWHDADNILGVVCVYLLETLNNFPFSRQICANLDFYKHFWVNFCLQWGRNVSNPSAKGWQPPYSAPTPLTFPSRYHSLILGSAFRAAEDPAGWAIRYCLVTFTILTTSF